VRDVPMTEKALDRVIIVCRPPGGGAAYSRQVPGYILSEF
jgi:hypothetical protein